MTVPVVSAKNGEPTLEDVAGNAYSIQEVDDLYIGYFWLWIIIVSVIVVAIGAVLVIFFVRKRKNN